MTGGIISGLGSLFGSLWKSYTDAKQAQVMDQGINYQKAKDSGDVLKNATDSKVIDADVDRMSDDSVRNSPYANRRD